MKKKLKIICFGGGNAMPAVILTELKKYQNFEITSIATVFDNGGSSGELRKELNVLPPGDLRRHFLALSEAPQWKKNLWNFKFGKEKFKNGHQGHSFGNIFIAFLEYYFKDFKKVSEIIKNFLNIKHNVFPITLKKTHLKAELENGQIIKGEEEIDVPLKHNPNLKIKKIFLEKKARIFNEAKKAILNAALIIIGPGDLYSSILPCFLPIGVKKAFKKTKAKKVFICPAMTKKGETENFSLLDFVNEIEKYIGVNLDYVIFNTKIADKKRIKNYKKNNPLFLNLVKFDKKLDKNKFIGKDLLLKDKIEYDSKKVIKILKKIFKF